MFLSKQLPFTVIDFETTGLHAFGNDRVIEIALVKVSPEGKVKESFTSLINPNRDLGPTHIHGIKASDVIEAPSFEDLAGTISEFVRDSIPVAHNAVFDSRFMTAEFQRIGYKLDIPWICTLRTCSALCDGLGGRSLADCCDYFEIELGNAHAALEDATATARILEKLCTESSFSSAFREIIILSTNNLLPFRSWPKLSSKSTPLPRTVVAEKRKTESSYIKQLLDSVPAGNFQEPAEQQYLLLLDAILEDRKITSEEFTALTEIASELGLTRGQLEGLHLVYLKDLLRLAWADKVITEFEKNDLETIRELLCIDTDTFKKCSEEIRLQNETYEAAGRVGAEFFGKSVCFTGQFQYEIGGKRVTRELAIELSEKHGMFVKKGVTKKLDLLVAADPDSLSGKAKKARDYGTRIVAEAAFWKILGV